MIECFAYRFRRNALVPTEGRRPRPMFQQSFDVRKRPRCGSSGLQGFRVPKTTQAVCRNCSQLQTVSNVGLVKRREMTAAYMKNDWIFLRSFSGEAIPRIQYTPEEVKAW